MRVGTVSLNSYYYARARSGGRVYGAFETLSGKQDAGYGRLSGILLFVLAEGWR